MSSIVPDGAECSFGQSSEPEHYTGGPRFIGGMHLTLGQVFGRAARHNLAEWFDGSDTYYVRAARTAIHRAVSLLSIGSGDDVLVPAYHCGSELDALLKTGVTVRFFKVSTSGEIDLEDLQSRLTANTKAVYVIHYFGFPQKMEPIVELCRNRKLYLIEDCALSLFTDVGSRRLGSAGDLAIYNFPKMLPVPDGGALVINRPELQRRPWLRRAPGLSETLQGSFSLLRQSLLRGLPRSAVRCLFAWFRGSSRAGLNRGRSRLEIPDSYYFSSAMTDSNISGVSAWLVGRMQVPEIRDRRRGNYTLLLNRISRISNLKPLFPDLPAGVCPLALPILVKSARELVRKLRAQTIPAIAWWAGYHSFFPATEEFEQARYLKDSVVALPIHQQLNSRDVDFIAAKTIECLA